MLAKSLLEEFRIDHIHGSTDQFFEFIANGDDSPAQMLLRLEFHQKIDIALRPKVIAQHRTEDRHPLNVMLAAKLSELLFGDWEPAIN